MTDTAAATNSANSKVLRIERLVEDRHRPTPERMAEIAGIVDQWRAETATTVTAGVPSAEETLARLRAVLGTYFDFDADPWSDYGACPEPEDVWRLHRDLRAVLAPLDQDFAHPPRLDPEVTAALLNTLLGTDATHTMFARALAAEGYVVVKADAVRRDPGQG